MSAAQLETRLNTDIKGVSFRFILNGQSSTIGQVTITNKTREDIDVKFADNLAFVLGISDFGVLKNKLSPDILSVVTLPASTSKKYTFDISRPIKELSLYSEMLINYKSELGYKKMAQADLSTLLSVDNSHDFVVVSFNSPKFVINSTNVKYATFYFKNSINEIIFFEFGELNVFYSKM